MDNNNYFDKLIEYRDLTIEQHNQKLFNTGLYMFKTNILKQYLDKVPYHPGVQEKYITDIIEILKNNNKKIKVIISNDYENFCGVNTQEELKIVENIMRNRLKIQYNDINEQSKYYKVM